MSRRTRPATLPAPWPADSVVPPTSTSIPANVNTYGLITAATDGDGTRWLTTRSGGSAERFGDLYLALSLALGAVGDALEACGLPPDAVRGRVALVLPHDVFVALRDALAAEDKGGDFLFKGPRRKTVDPLRLVTMLRGVVIASELAEGFSLPERVACPMRSKPR